MSVLVARAQQHTAATAALVVVGLVFPNCRAPFEAAAWTVRARWRLDPVLETVETGAVPTGGYWL